MSIIRQDYGELGGGGSGEAVSGTFAPTSGTYAVPLDFEPDTFIYIANNGYANIWVNPNKFNMVPITTRPSVYWGTSTPAFNSTITWDGNAKTLTVPTQTGVVYTWAAYKENQ